MADMGGELTIEELAARTGVPIRTVRYYIAEGLLPGPGTRGKGASYGEDHLLRLQLIRRLAERRVPLAEQRAQLVSLSTAQVRSLLADETQQADQLRVAESSGPAYVAALLGRAQAARRPPVPSPPAALSRPAEAPPPAALEGNGARWQRIELAPGVELHVQDAAADRQRNLIDRILRAAGIARRDRQS